LAQVEKHYSKQEKTLFGDLLFPSQFFQNKLNQLIKLTLKKPDGVFSIWLFQVFSGS